MTAVVCAEAATCALHAEASSRQRAALWCAAERQTTLQLIAPSPRRSFTRTSPTRWSARSSSRRAQGKPPAGSGRARQQALQSTQHAHFERGLWTLSALGNPRRDGMLPSVAGRVAKQAAAAGGILPRAVQQVHLRATADQYGISS